jgi:hypothetical protein
MRLMKLLTRYARSGKVQIAYQLAGEGPLDLVVVPRSILDSVTVARHR